jgi:hypothetical protein
MTQPERHRRPPHPRHVVEIQKAFSVVRECSRFRETFRDLTVGGVRNCARESCIDGAGAASVGLETRLPRESRCLRVVVGNSKTTNSRKTK